MATPYVQRINRYIERLFNARGGSPLVSDVDSSIEIDVPILIGVEDRYLQGWNKFAVVANQPAVSAQFSRIRIRNPVGSNVIVVLEQLALFTTTAGADNPIVTWGPTTTDLATLVTLSFTRMDPRGNPQPTSIVSTNAQAAGGQALLQRAYTGANIVADFINQADQQIPILPGQVVDMQSNAANTQLIATLMWRERALEPSELV